MMRSVIRNPARCKLRDYDNAIDRIAVNAVAIVNDLFIFSSFHWLRNRDILAEEAPLPSRPSRGQSRRKPRSASLRLSS